MSMENPLSRSLVFDPLTGLSPAAKPLRRRLSAMKGMYADASAFDAMVRAGDPLVYEFFDLRLPETAAEIAFGTTITYPGRVGDEYFMTKGHFHRILETGEVYYCLRGQGLMLMENPEGDWETRDMAPGAAVYVPPRYAHRSINVSANEPLISFFAFRADAGHDYGTIETRGFRKLVVEKDGRAVVADNPKWGASRDRTS
jgi:glucose-6-phosphate isomerase